MIDVQIIPTGQLLNDYRDILLRLGGDRTDTALSKSADLYEAEISRRMAW